MFIGGYNNSTYQRTGATSPSLIYGEGNVAITDGCIVLGKNNELKTQQANHVTIVGNSNKAYTGMTIVGHDNSGGNTDNSGFLFGQHLYHVGNIYSSNMVIGQMNNQTVALNKPTFILGCGTNTTTKRKNALEVNYTDCKILNNLQLATDSTAVNAITPPSDPSNPTADEQTLATKAYVASQVPSLAALEGITFKRSYTAVTGQITTLTPNTDHDLETLFSITIPSWATHMIIGYDIGQVQGYVRLALNVSGAYTVLMPDQDISKMYSYNLGWNPTTKELYLSNGFTWTNGTAAVDSGLAFSIMSIRFEGDYTPFPVSP